MTTDDQIPDTIRPSQIDSVCWQQQLRSATASAQDRTGRILVLVGDLADEITGLGMDLVSILRAVERGTNDKTTSG